MSGFGALLAAVVPGITGITLVGLAAGAAPAAAQEPRWLAPQPIAPAPQPVQRPTATDPSLARQQAVRAAPGNPAQQEKLFQQFLEWSKQQQR
jgi:hypothetical protein